MLKLDALQRTWYVQLAIFGGVALVVYGAFWYFVTSSTRAETHEVEAKVESLRRANAGAVVASRASTSSRPTTSAPGPLRRLETAAARAARAAGWFLAERAGQGQGAPDAHEVPPQDEVQQDFYTGKPIEVEVSGTYNNVGQFFAQMASYQRIVSITDFKVTKLKEKKEGEKVDGQTVSAEFLVTAYYVSPEKLQPPPADDKKGKGQNDKDPKAAKAAD